MRTAGYESKIEMMEQYNRRNNVIISGIPVKVNENVRQIVLDLAQVWNIPLHDLEIVAAHRLFAKSGMPDIIAKLLVRDKVGQIIKKSKAEKKATDCLQMEPI